MTVQAFQPLQAAPGFYPVLPDAQWVRKALGWGVRTVQLRCKAGAHRDAELAQQVQAAVSAGRAVAGSQVFINDHWRLALAAGAYGVHLGQEDWAALAPAERALLCGSGMRLGLSTHTPEELTLAKSARPSYLAIGPVYSTTLKVMPYEPVGLERLALWRAQAGACPVVAIGGISLERMHAVWACGVQGVAVVSALTQAPDPHAAAFHGLRACSAARPGAVGESG